MLNIQEPTQASPKLHPQGQSRIKTTADLIGVHHQTLRRWWKAGTFPEPININGILLFRNADVLAWLASRDLIDEPANVPDNVQEA